MKEKSLIICFIGIIYGIFISLPISFLMGRTIDASNIEYYTPTDEVTIVDVFNNRYNELKTSLENRVNNYFPFYNEVVTIYENFNFYTNKLVYDDVPIKENSDNEYIFYDKVNNLYYLKMPYSSEELDERVATQIDFFNNLDNNNLDVYIYLPTRIDLTTLKEDNLSRYISLFKNGLNEDISMEVMNITSIDQYKKYFYTTDHHWTMYGALDGYYDIMDMLENKPLDIPEVKEYDTYYYGSMAKASRNDTIHDTLSDIELELNYDVTYHGDGGGLEYKPREIAQSDNKYYDYYVDYFNGSYGEVIYDYHQESEENLLILCDSYAWQIDYLIAASFNKTYVINLRYDEFEGNNFYIYDYVRENNIDKVLFLYNGTSTLFDAYNYNFTGRVK